MANSSRKSLTISRALLMGEEYSLSTMAITRSSGKSEKEKKQQHVLKPISCLYQVTTSVLGLVWFPDFSFRPESLRLAFIARAVSPLTVCLYSPPLWDGDHSIYACPS